MTEKLRVVFCWTGLTGYMPSCWRALMRHPDVDLRVYIEKRRTATQTAFEEKGLSGIHHRIRNREDPLEHSWIREICDFRPDVIQVTGWFSHLSRAVASAAAVRSVPKILGLDHPYQGTLRQQLAPWVLGRYLRRFQAVCVSGERAAGYARHLGFADRQIEMGLYGFDYSGFAEAGRMRASGAWPERFMFAGRYCQDKGLDCLAQAYAQYRARVQNPWALSCCGMGPMSDVLRRVEGVTDLGFQKPEKMPGLFAEQGVFILPSRYEPWGVALGEACASGMPVIATRACGSAVELVRPYFNGLLCEAGSCRGLCEAMAWMHHHRDELPAMGARSQKLAEPYAAEEWARRWREITLKWRLGS